MSLDETDQVRPIRVRAAGRSDTGLSRAENQDRLLIADLATLAEGVPGGDHSNARADGVESSATGPVEFDLGPLGGILLVADGMGGVAGGGVASGLAVAAIRAAVVAEVRAAGELDAPGFAAVLRDALHVANARIHDEAAQDSRYRGMGTTATLAGVLDGVVYLAQVGDSRAYLVRDGRAVRLTRDQSLVQDFVDAGVLTEDEARSVEDGTLLQALGVAPRVKPELTAQELRRGDVVLLCSDGLSRVVVDDEIGGAVRRATDCSALCDELVELANQRGGPDNVTVVAACFAGEGLREARGDEPVGRKPYDLPRG
jgi:protein phosphatase